MAAARPLRADHEQESAAEQAGAGGATGGDEERRQLRVAGRADGEARHRQRHREHDDAEKAESEATRLPLGEVAGGRAGAVVVHFVHGVAGRVPSDSQRSSAASNSSSIWA